MIGSAPMRAVRGVSLIEVLVAIVIFSLGVLGLALMELKGATFTKEAGARTAAVLQARSLVDRMQANPTGVAEGAYNWTQATMPTNCSAEADASSVLACNDLVEWLTQVKMSAPAAINATAGYGHVVANTDGTYTITVSWNGLLDMTGSGTPQDVSESVVFYPTGIGAGS